MDHNCSLIHTCTHSLSLLQSSSPTPQSSCKLNPWFQFFLILTQKKKKKKQNFGLLVNKIEIQFWFDTNIFTVATPEMMVSVVVFSEYPKLRFLLHLQYTGKTKIEIKQNWFQMSFFSILLLYSFIFFYFLLT